MSGFDLLVNGKFFDSVLYPYQSMLGTTGMELFYGIIILSAFGLLYIKSKSPTLVSILMLVSGVVFIGYLPPTTTKLIYGLMVFSVAYLIYKIYKTR